MGTNIMSLVNVGGKLKKLGGDLQMMKQKPYDSEVEYLESDGNQYIDLGVKADWDSILKIDMGLTEVSASRAVFGSFSTNQCYHVYISSTSCWQYGISTWGTSASSADTSRHTIEMKNRKGYLDGEEQWNTQVTSTEQTANTVLVFNIHKADGSLYAGAKMRLYSMSFDEMDLIPVRNGSVGYLYDRNSGRMYANSGSGSFAFGDDK